MTKYIRYLYWNYTFILGIYIGIIHSQNVDYKVKEYI